MPSVMIFDDHVHDDWNTSETWLEEMRSKPWWEERIVGAFMSYWIYQHRQPSPEELEEYGLFENKAQDASRVLRKSLRRTTGRPGRAAGASTVTSGRCASSSWTQGPVGC